MRISGILIIHLTLLENQALIEGKWEDPKKRTVRIYNITDLGVQELIQISAIMIPKLRQSIDVLENIADDLDSAEYRIENKPSDGA